jgi:predicted phosphodiesterase
MRIAICSDVHLEFGPITLYNDNEADVLVLSGDICTAKDLEVTDSILSSAKTDRFLEFFATCSKNFPHVVYVMGNHEHYHGDYATSIHTLKAALKSYENIHVLDKEIWDHGDYRFMGGTLWTDMNGEDETTMNHVQNRMNDFRICANSNRVVNYRSFEEGKAKFHERPAKLSPQDALEDHKAMMRFLEDSYKDTPPWMSIVICGHHAPSKLSEHPKYKHDKLMNGAYNSKLDQFILDRPGIKLWTHGHTHEDFDYMIGSTRVVCNPRGYIDYEDRADRFMLKTIEV